MDYPKSVPNVGLVNGKFVDENTTTGQVGSLIPASWGNAVTSEILNVLKAASIAPDELSNDQLYKAISKIVAESGFTKEDLNKKADKALTLGGYGITDGMQKNTGGLGTTAPIVLGAVSDVTDSRFISMSLGQTTDTPSRAGYLAGIHVKYPDRKHALDIAGAVNAEWLGFRNVSFDGTGRWLEVWHEANFNPSSKADVSAVNQASEAARGTVMLAGFADVNAGDGFKAMTANMFMNFSLGFRQVWRDMLGSRAAGVGYLNSTGKPIMVSVISSTADRGLYIHVDGVVVSKQGQEGGTGSDFNCVQAIIPPGSTYAVGLLGGAVISHWAELRA